MAVGVEHPAANAASDLRSALSLARDAAGGLRDKLHAVIAAESVNAGELRDAIVTANVKEVQQLHKSSGKLLDARAVEIRALTNGSTLSTEYRAGSEGIATDLTQASGHLERLVGPTDAAIAAAKTASAELYDVVQEASFLVAADEIRDWRSDADVGTFMVYDQEYLLPQDRKTVLARVALRSKAIRGISVDVAAGRVYKLPTHVWAKTWRYSVFPFALLILGLAAVVAGDVLPNTKPLGTPGHMCEGLGLVLFGALVHGFFKAFTSGVLKRVVSDVTVVSTWGASLLLRPLQPLLLLAAPVITFIALVATSAEVADAEGLSLFILSGYSCDSIARNAVDGIDDAAKKTAESVFPPKKAPDAEPAAA